MIFICSTTNKMETKISLGTFGPGSALLLIAQIVSVNHLPYKTVHCNVHYTGPPWVALLLSDRFNL